MRTKRTVRVATSLSRCLVHCFAAIVLLMGVQSAAAYTLSNPNATPEAKAQFRYFADEVYGKRCLMEFDVTKFVTAQIAKDGVATFVLKGDPGYNHVRMMEYPDAAFRPQLVIDATTPISPVKAPNSGQPERPKP